MPDRCSIPECRAISNKLNGKISMFRLPRDANLRSKWLKSIGKKDWNPSEKSVICEKHFEPSCIVKTPLQNDKDSYRPKIVMGSLPTILVPPGTPLAVLERSKKVRKRVKKKLAMEGRKKKGRKRKKAVDLDSMPLQQRLTSIASTSTAPEPEKPIPTLKSQPLSPTKLKVTRQSTLKPQQQQLQTPKQKPAEPEEVQAPIREEVCLKWNTHHSNMQTAFPALLNKEQYCDVTLVAEGMSLKCHKLILSSCSAYFDQVLEKVAPYQHPIIFMKDIPFNIMKSLCDFMYVGEVNILHSDLDQILAVGESLKIKGLANKSGNNASTDKPSSIETRKVPAVKTPKATSKPSNLEKNESVEEPDITDPLDLMEPTYEEAATPDVPPAALKRNEQARKSTGKRVRKRKHVEVDHEPSPPVFRMRKGTRSRPNVKVPRYFNANFDNSLPSSEPEPSEFVQSNEAEESFNDPFMNILDEIKTEPLDIEDNFEDESYIHEMTHRETDTETYDPGPIVEETEKVLKKVRTYRGAIVAKQEKPDPLNVDQTVGTLNQAEEMEIDNSDQTENQEENYREEALPVLTGTSDGDDMQIENSEMEVDSELEERTVEVNEPLHLENSENAIHEEDIDRQVIRLQNCEQENLPEIVNEQNETINDEETQLDNTTEQTQPVENSDSHIENSDTNIENSDMNVETSDMNIENSDVHIENSDMNIENSDMHIENSDTIVENSDKEEIQGNNIENVHLSQDETQVDSCERRDIMKEDSIQVVHSAGVNSREEGSDIIENETDKSDVQGVSKHCNEEVKTFNDSERNSENIAEETSEEKLKAVEDGAQELNSEETQLLPNEKLNEVSINTSVPEEFKSNDLCTTEEDPLL